MQEFFITAIALEQHLTLVIYIDVEYFENSNSGLSVSPAEPFTVQGTVSYEF
jgi:hypothetical protein